MAAQVGSLRVTVGADITGLQTGFARAQREVRRGAAGMQKSVGDLQLTFKELATFASRSLRVLGGTFAIGFGAKEILSLADAAKSLSAQLKLATAEYGSFEKANKDVQAIAKATRSDLLATADLYSSLQRNSGQLGATQVQVARATQTVAEAFKISGAATSEQSAATRQLIQAFQSGVLRGDEFNSIMENAPRLSRLLADSLGVTVGKLRAMAEAGELTADKLLAAFTDKKFTAGIDNEFQQLPVTFEQAMSQLYNSALVTFGEFDRGGQFSNSIANFVQDGSEGFDSLGQHSFKFGQDVGDTFTAIELIRKGLGDLKTEGIGSFLGLTDATLDWHKALAGALGILDDVINGFQAIPHLPGNFVRAALGMPLYLPGTSNMQGNFLQTTKQKSLAATRQQIMGRTAGDVLAEFGLQRIPPPFHAPAPKAKKGKKPPRDRSADVEFQFAQQLKQAQLDVLQAQKSLVQNSEARAQLSLQILDVEKSIHDAEVDDRVRKAERDKADGKITASALEQVKAQAGQLKAEYDKKDALERQAVTAELVAQKAEDAAALRDVDFDIEKQKLENESRLAETASEQRDVQLRLLDLSYRQEKARLEAIIAEEEAKDIAQQNLVRLEEARRQLAALPALQAGEKAGVIASTRGPMEDYLASLPTTAAKAQEALERLQVQGFEGLIDAAVALTEGFDNAKDALLNTLKQFLQGLLRMELQKGLGSLMGSSGGIFGALGGLFGGSGGGAMSAGGFSLDSSISSLWTEVPHFAGGGALRIGGTPGIDKNMLSINGIPAAMVSYGERIDVSNDNGRRMGGHRSGDVIFNVNTPDADSFRRNQRQMTRDARRRLGV